MPSFVSPSDPSLLAILVVIQARTGSGSHLLFHFPPDPLVRVNSQSSQSDLDDEISSSETEEDSSTEEEEQIKGTKRNGSKGQYLYSYGSRAVLTDEDDEADVVDEPDGQADQHWQPTWEPLLGLGSVGLASLLAPGRLWHKKRFELGINDLCFIGWPAFAHEDGQWKRKNFGKATSEEGHDTEPQHQESFTVETDTDDEIVSKDDDIIAVQEEDKGHRKSDLTMFNIVFVLDPPALEYNLRVREMYNNVVKKLARALRKLQMKRDYVGTEVELIQSIKTRHFTQHSTTDALYSDLLNRSTLASAIASVYKAISNARIASVELPHSRILSLQIPPITSTSVLPSLVDEPIPAGLWLTTVNDPSASTSEIDVAYDSSQLFRHFTLLLQDSPHKMIKEVQTAGGPLAMPLCTFIAALNPAKSFHKISTASHIPLPEIQRLAHLLMYWRRAIAIPPLHQRDTYIVSPNADMTKLKPACKSYEALFPTLPGLEKILVQLSETPRPWGTLIPSTDHKEAYYQVLAWLMRGGWVTQLRTFAYVRVGPEIKKAVREKEMQEKQQRLQEKKAILVEDDEEENNGSLASSQKRPSIMSRPSSDGRQNLSDLNFKHDPHAASLILNPQRSSALESKWLEYITESILTTNYSSIELSAEERLQLQKYWLQWLKYFDGSEPLEKIPVREGLKRKFVWDLLGKLGLNFDASVEDSRVSPQGRILMTVRHW